MKVKVEVILDVKFCDPKRGDQPILKEVSCTTGKLI